MPLVLQAPQASHLVAVADKIDLRAAGFTPIEKDTKGKAFRSYLFSIHVPGCTAEQVAPFRFSDLRRLHHDKGWNAWAGFPSRHVFRDMNKEKNSERRSSELAAYLCSLLNSADEEAGGTICLDDQLHTFIGCSPTLASGLAVVGRARAARLAAIMQQQRDDRDFAQGVNRVSPLPGQTVTIFYPRELKFQLRTRGFSRREEVHIMGPGKLEWFRMQQVSPIFSSRDTQVISNLAGEPVLALHRLFRPGVWEYRLERITAGMVQVPMCLVTRLGHGDFRETYVIGLLASGFGQRMVCQGTWTKDFAFHLDGTEACRVRHHFGDLYDVTIQPQRDVLLFLGVACAIDHIEHEIEEAKTAREAQEDGA